MQKIQGFVQEGNTTLSISGAAGTISQKVNGSFPSATITVYKAGTVILASIYSDNSSTVKANPFTAAADGTWFFYAPSGRYDVKFSGAGISAPFTLGDFLFFDEETVWANVVDAQFGADNTGVSDSSAAFTAALAAADIVQVPFGTYRWNSTISLTTGKCLIAFGTSDRWRGDSQVIIDFRGTTAAISIAPGVGVGVDTVYLRGIQIDGTNVSGNVDGLLLDADAGGGAYIEGVILEHCSITNFPRNQIRSLDIAFDVTLRHCSLNNADRSADDLVSIGGTVATSEWTFDDCFLAQYTAAKWCINAGRATALATNGISDLRMIGGTVTQVASGAGSNGIWVYGSLHVYGCHFEGNDSADTANVAIRFTGSGAFICPSNLSVYGRGIEVGNPNVKTTEAQGCIITGNVGFNNYAAGGVDCVIVDGGDRSGTGIAVMGFFTTQAFTLQNDRQTVDGNRTDLRFLFTNTNTVTQLSGPIGIGIAPQLWLTILAARQNGIRLLDSENSNGLTAQLLTDANGLGNLSLYNTAASNRVIINGDGSSAYSSTGAAAVDATAIMTLTSTTKGFLPPRMTTAQRDAIVTPSAGMIIYNTTTGAWNGYNGAWVVIGP